MNADIIVAIGGDGTFHKTIHSTDAMVLPVYSGSLGFFSNTFPDEVISTLKAVLNGKYVIEERDMLQCTINDGTPINGLNETVIHTLNTMKLCDFQFSIDDEAVKFFRGDGIILSTSTGSTGYNMSAGGPIIEPTQDCRIITTISVFQPFVRPMVVSSDRTIEVKIMSQKRECICGIDGYYEKPVSSIDTIKITASKKKARIIRTKKYNYFEKVFDRF